MKICMAQQQQPNQLLQQQRQNSKHNFNVNDNHHTTTTTTKNLTTMLIEADVHNDHHRLNSLPWSLNDPLNFNDNDIENDDPSYLLRTCDNQSILSLNTNCSSIIDDYNDDDEIEDKVLNKLDNILMSAIDDFGDDDENTEQNDPDVVDNPDDDDDTISTCSSQSSIICRPLNQQEETDDNVEMMAEHDDNFVVDDERKEIISMETMNRGNFLRKIERFGNDVRDKCLFPLALPMDGSDIYRGHSTWESINLLADCVLMLWTTTATTTTTKKSSTSMNNILNDPIRFLCLNPELMDRRKFPYAKSSSVGRRYDPLPFRRWCSELDLRDLHQSVKSADDNGDGQKSGNGKEQEQEDTERILENFYRKSRTDCRQLANEQELKNPKRLAGRITRLEQRNFLRITRREILNYLFGKIQSNNLNLKQMIRFSEELSELVGCWILRERSVEGRKQLIASIIEVAFILFMGKNFQSFESVMRGLRLPLIYSLHESWLSLRRNNPIHFRIYQHLTKVIFNQLQQKSLIFYPQQQQQHSSGLSSKLPSSTILPSLYTFFELLKLRSLPIVSRLIDDNGDHHDHHIDIRNHLGNQSLIDIINEYQCNNDVVNLRHVKFNGKRQRKQRNKMAKKRRFWPFPGFKRKRNQPKSTTINDNDDEDQNAEIAASYLSLLTKKFDSQSINDAFHRRDNDDDCLRSLRLYIEQQFINENDQKTLPDRWQYISLRNLNSNIHRLLAIQFFHLYKNFIEQIEQYRF
uniref:Uncharacterized protein LOC113788841 isoform X1 n=1 Tax=Dermatophagoides pteronyssinus TaxID=6956 RepID=A0A6P6XL27_DERPT|nr:uncharacterized protein LOC113788841 isoform X1 [Dermatophagoides pteronyssinus]